VLYTVQSDKPLDQLSRDLEEAVQRNKFGIVGVHDLKETMQKKGVDFKPRCLIYEVCNPHQAKRVLEADMEISTALPCRISLYEEGTKSALSTIKPTAMLALFGKEELEAVAREVEETVIRIMNEAAR